MKLGSSPLTRGAPNQYSLIPHILGLIPAHAGSTNFGGSRPARVRAHPRSRGEHLACHSAQPTLLGSSPLTRGARLVITGGRGVGRLIPAHAGSTRRLARRKRCRAAHPRSRGEHDWFRDRIDAIVGSSPLTRGARLRNGRGRRGAGLIPAHAGSTLRASGPPGQLWAHPRSRGEHSESVSAIKGSMGSSPLTRGAPRGEIAMF